MQYCNACGAENTDTAQFCGQCGTPLGAGPVGPSPPRQSTLSLQTLLHNRYLVRKLLGQGGMGAVYLAEDQQVFNRLCVVKEMLPFYSTPAEKQQAEQNFEREARLLSSLRNPGIPQIYDYFIESNRYYLVMQWVEGENLEHRIAQQSGPLPEEDVRDYALQLANILVYIAKQNPPVIHRDIKPANIILDDEGKVSLVDFGIAKATTGTGQTGGMSIPLGTPGYSPPEQYSGQVEPRTDVYALGVTLHHLLTGRDPRNEPPFHFPPARTLAPGVSPEMEGILTETLRSDVALRPTPVELRAKLESLVAPQPTAQPQPFTFRSGDVVTSLFELAAACDQHWDEAIEHLYAGDFEPWLEQWNRKDLAVRAASIRRRGGDRSAGLEELIRAVDHTMPMPALALSQTTLDLGTVERGERRTFNVDVMNAGRGYLHGEAEIGVPWTRVSPRTFGLMAGEQSTLTVTVDTSDLDEGSVRQAIAEVRSNGGLEPLTCQADVTWQPQLSLEPQDQLNFGAVLEGEEQPSPVTATFVVRNTGGGTLEGYIGASVPWLRLDTADFRLSSGGSVTVSAEADPDWSGGATAQVGHIQITTPTATLDLPAYVSIQKTWYTGGPRISAWLAYGLLVLLGYLGAAIPVSVGLAVWLGWPTPDDAIVTALLMGLVLSPVGLYLSQRWVSRLDELEDFHHRGSLADELVSSQFSWQKVAWLAGAGLVIGGLLGWRLADQLPGGGLALSLLAGGLMGAVAGVLLAAEGEPSPVLPSDPPWLANIWQGPTIPILRQPSGGVGAKSYDTVKLDASDGTSDGTQGTAQVTTSTPTQINVTLATSPTYAVLRSVVLMLIGGALGVMAGSLVYGQAQPKAALIGTLLGLLMSSESHRLLAARVRWLLAHARLAGWMILGAYLAVTAPMLLRWGQPWTIIAGYGRLDLHFPGLQELSWLVLLMAAAPVGAVSGLWVADGAGRPWPRAQRTFLGLVGTLAITSLPVYVILAVLMKALDAGPVGDWIVILAVLGAAAGAAWAMWARRAQVEAALAEARDVVSRGWELVKGILPAAGQRAWGALGLTANWSRLSGRIRLPNLRGRLSAPAWVGRLRSRWSRLTLAELSTEMTIPLTMGAVGTTVIVQEMLAKTLVGLTVGLGTVVLYTLVLILIIAASVVGLRYLRNR